MLILITVLLFFSLYFGISCITNIIDKIYNACDIDDEKTKQYNTAIKIQLFIAILTWCIRDYLIYSQM